MITNLLAVESIGLVNSCGFVSGADGIGDTEGKAAMGSGERTGRQASFKFVLGLNNSDS
jgi:hypothetical protein